MAYSTQSRFSGSLERCSFLPGRVLDGVGLLGARLSVAAYCAQCLLDRFSGHGDPPKEKDCLSITPRQPFVKQ